MVQTTTNYKFQPGWNDTSSSTPRPIIKKREVLRQEELTEQLLVLTKSHYDSVTDDFWYTYELEVKATEKTKNEHRFIERLKSSFQQIKNVNALFLERYHEEFCIKVLLSNKKYDDHMMDMLLDQEILIRDEFPSLALDFNYIPLMGRSTSDLISTSAKMVFKASN